MLGVQHPQYDNTKDYTEAVVGIKVSSCVGLEVEGVICPVLWLLFSV